MNYRKRLLGGSSLAISTAILAVWYVAVGSNAQNVIAQGSTKSLRELRDERIATLKGAITDATALMAEGRAVDNDRFNRLTRQLVEAELEAATSKEDRILVLESAIRAAKKTEEQIDTQRKAGRPIDTLTQSEAKAYRIGLEIQSALEKLRTAQP